LQWATLFDAFLVESKWLSANQVPSLDDYLSNGVITTGAPLALLHLFFMAGHDPSTAGSANLNSGHIPPIMSCPSKILRLWDDMGSAKVRTLRTSFDSPKYVMLGNLEFHANIAQLNIFLYECSTHRKKGWTDRTRICT
jgi:hypothetical protein